MRAAGEIPAAALYISLTSATLMAVEGTLIATSLTLLAERTLI